MGGEQSNLSENIVNLINSGEKFELFDNLTSFLQLKTFSEEDIISSITEKQIKTFIRKKPKKIWKFMMNVNFIYSFKTKS